MKNNRCITILMVGLIATLQLKCKKDEVPTITTSEITSISQTSAISGGEMINSGTSQIISKGVCWSTSIEPTISNNKTTDGDGSEDFTSNITGLNPGTTYFVRAYATNSEGTGYGLAKSCSTGPATVAVITTSMVTSITQTSAVSGGIIVSDGASTITSCGVCWGTSQNPTINNNKTTEQISSGTFTSNITGLTGNTTYYLRAYSTNSIGTAYGDEISFKTSPILPEIDPLTISSITAISANCKMSITNDGGATVISRGICFGTNANPTISNSKTDDGSGVGAFVSQVNNLSNNTTYYIRGFATNSVGTQYTNELNFKTLTPISDIEGNTYNIVSIGNQIWMANNLKTTKLNDGTDIPNITDGTTWYNLTTPGFCWFNNDMIAYKSDYGGLYNWFTVLSGKLCPQGWHVPSDSEWTTLTTTLGGVNVSGGKLKETGTIHWNEPNAGATNEGGFSALPGGIRAAGSGFYNNGGYGAYWTSTEYSINYAWFRYIYYHYANVNRDYSDRKTGLSIRCIKD